MIASSIARKVLLRSTANCIHHRFTCPPKSLFSTSEIGYDENLVQTKVNGGTATLTLSRPPVNSLSLELCQSISGAVNFLETQYPNLQGVVIKSSNPSVFSAGLDLMELHNPDRERLSKFWISFQNVFVSLYGTRLATVAAIEGHATAGGCMLALCCDYRVMVSSTSYKSAKQGPRIGLNETLLGMAAPQWMIDQMIRTVGFREAELALSKGSLYTPEHAFDVGLVDSLVARGDAVSEAHSELQKFTNIPPLARYATKMGCRQKYLDEFHSSRTEDLERFSSYVLNETVQANISAYLKQLKQKKH